MFTGRLIERRQPCEFTGMVRVTVADTSASAGYCFGSSVNLNLDCCYMFFNYSERSCQRIVMLTQKICIRGILFGKACSKNYLRLSP
jgi:hypothetical protein